jgi:hypothetical protein
MKRMSQKESLHYIATRQDFKASALEGYHGTASKESARTARGRLNVEEWAKLIDSAEIQDYVVFSYDTPIAWHTSNGWYIVSQKFSVVTSKHQDYVRRAVAESLVGAN